MIHNPECPSLKAEQLCDIIQQLYENGTLKRLFLAGLVSNKILLYFEIYLEVKKRREKTKYKRTNIILHEVAEKYNVSIQTVYRANKVFYQNTEKEVEK